MSEEFKFITPPIDIDKNVAVIGSSYNLMNNEYGEEIDTFTDVIRFNRAPINGYEKHVGTKTTIRVTNNHVFSGQRPDNRFKIETQNPNFIKNQKNCKIICVKHIIDGKKFVHETSKDYYIVNINNLKTELELNKDPTVGLMMLYVLLKNGYKPTLFGFGVNESPNPTHYWEKLKHKSQHHNLSKEKFIIKQWESEGKLILKL